MTETNGAEYPVLSNPDYTFTVSTGNWSLVVRSNKILTSIEAAKEAFRQKAESNDDYTYGLICEISSDWYNDDYYALSETILIEIGMPEIADMLKNCRENMDIE